MGGKLNIIVQNPYMQAGGAENRIKLLLQELVRRPEIDTLHFVFSGLEPAHTVQAEEKFHLWQIKPGANLPVLRNIMKEWDIDVFQFHNNQEFGTRGLELAQSKGIPTVYVMHDFWPLCYQRFMMRVWDAESFPVCIDTPTARPYECLECVGEYYYNLYLKQLEAIKKCDVGIVPSNRIKDIFEKNNVLVGKWKIVEPWIDLTAFTPAPIQKRPYQVFFAGNYIPHKGFRVLLRAWAHVNKRLPMANLLAQGDSRVLDETINYSKNHKVQNVQLIEHVPQERLRELYSESAITVFPSIWEETIGLIWVESLACGTPVICSRTGSIPELLKFGGETFEPRDDVELAERIIDILLSPSKQRKYAQEGYDYVKKNFSPIRAGDDFLKIYTKLEVDRYAKQTNKTVD